MSEAGRARRRAVPDPTTVPSTANAPASPLELSPDELARTTQVLSAEYGLLMACVGAVWSASLVRTSIYLMVLSASGVALGFAAQADPAGGAFRMLAIVVLPLVLFLGVATFVRLVQVQRESVVYITGLNRIRHFFQEIAPVSRPYHILPAHDDAAALYRSMGTGMSPRPPRRPLVYLVVQTQGIVGIVTGLVASALAGLATLDASGLVAWLAAGVAFVVTVGLLFAYWQRSLAELLGSIRPLHPTPPDEVGAPF